MKLYLVSYKTSGFTIESIIVEMPDDYVPRSDRMKLLKEKVTSLALPECKELIIEDEPNCNEHCYYMKPKGKVIRSDDLVIISVSNLDV